MFFDPAPYRVRTPRRLGDHWTTGSVDGPNRPAFRWALTCCATSDACGAFAASLRVPEPLNAIGFTFGTCLLAILAKRRKASVQRCQVHRTSGSYSSELVREAEVGGEARWAAGHRRRCCSTLARTSCPATCADSPTHSVQATDPGEPSGRSGGALHSPERPNPPKERRERWSRRADLNR